VKFSKRRVVQYDDNIISSVVMLWHFVVCTELSEFSQLSVDRLPWFRSLTRAKSGAVEKSDRL